LVPRLCWRLVIFWKKKPPHDRQELV
jgi:hypothetical protein